MLKFILFCFSELRIELSVFVIEYIGCNSGVLIGVFS